MNFKVVLSLLAYCLLAFDSIQSYTLPENVNWDKLVFKFDTFQNLIKTKQLNCSQVIDYFTEKALIYNKYINAIISFNLAQAKQEALQQDEYFYANNKFVGKLHCIPTLIKDNIDVKGLPTTGGIKALRYSIPNEDAVVVARLRAEGAIIMGKSNLAELGVGMRYESELGQGCRNPYDLERNCGASSSGSAASISAGLALLTLGTDTDGSIIGPACFNSLNAIRSATNVMNMTGIIPLFEYQDTVGPLTKYVDDLVLAYSIMTDNPSMHANYTSLKSNLKAIKSIKVGYLTNVLNTFTINTIMGTYDYDFDEEVLESCKSFIRNLKKLTNVSEVTLNQTKFNEFINSIEPTVLGRLKCQDACLKKSLDKYFNNTDRFFIDAPYHNFNEFFKSPLLSDFWKSFLEDSNVENPIKFCQDECVDDKLNKQNFTRIIDEWFELTNSDVLFYPSFNMIPAKLDSKEQDLSLIIIASYTGYASLNVPIDFTRVGLNSNKSMPSGMTLLAKPENTEKLFLVSKLYESLFKPINNSLDPNLPLFDSVTIKPSSNAATATKPATAILLVLILINMF